MDESTAQSRHRLTQELFVAARDMPTHERELFLRDRCGDDQDLRRSVERLLAYAEGNADFLERPTASDVLPARIGPFRILEKLGEGGMGTVYEARQDHPSRPVALKVLRAGSMSAQLLARFEREGELLGRLQHPGIAHVYQSGTADTDVGRQPYFAMELVRGKSLTDFATAHALDVDARLELVSEVCDAVAHAHARGVVHRDLKPSNILVDEAGRPHVLDFGVARILDEDADSQAVRTQTGQVIGTPAYMSPEQASGRPDSVDARADVFALGVLAFELLTGRLPRDFTGLSYPETMRRVAEGETSVLGSVDPALKGDHETVVAKAMASEPARRYADARELRADLRRLLRSEPIAARPATTFYRISRFVRRYRALSGSLAALFVALVTGAAVSLSLLVESRANEREARWEGYVGSLIGAVGALEAGSSAEARGLLDAAPEEHRGWEWHYLRNRLDGSLRASAPGPTNVRAIAMHPDGQRLAAAGGASANWPGVQDYAVRLYDAQTLELERELFDARDHAEDDVRGRSILQLAYAADGAELVALSRRNVFVIDAATGEALGALTRTGANEVWREDARGFCAFAVQRDDVGERRILVAAALATTGRIEAWSGADPPEVLRRVESIPSAIALTKDDALLAVGRRDGVLELVDGESMETLHALDLSSWNGAPNYAGLWGITALDFDRDGERLLVGTSGGCIALVDALGGEVLQHHLTGAPLRELRHFGDEGGYVSTSLDASLRLWGADGYLQETLFGHEDRIDALAVTPDGSRVVTGGLDRTLRVWDARPGAARTALRGEAWPFTGLYRLALDAAGERIAWQHSPRLDGGPRTAEVRITDARSGEPLVTLPGMAWGKGGGRVGSATSLAFSADGERLYTLGEWDRVRVWDAHTGELLRVGGEVVGMGGLAPDGSCYLEHRRADGQPLLASIDVDHLETLDLLLRCVSTEPGADVLWEVGLSGLGFPVGGGWTEDGSRLMTVYSSGQTEVRELASGDVLFERAVLDGGRYTTLVSPAGDHFATVPLSGFKDVGAYPEGRTIQLREFENGRVLQEWPGRAGVVSGAFIADGARLALGHMDGSITIADPRRGPIVTLPGHEEMVAGVAFAAGRLVSVDLDAAILIRDAASTHDRSEARAEAAGTLALQREVRPLVEALHERLMLRTDVLAALEANDSLSEEQRAAAARLACTLPFPASFAAGYPFHRAWELAIDPDAGSEAHERAQRIADFVADLKPGPDYRVLAVQGYASIRLGRLQEGLTALAQSLEIAPTHVPRVQTTFATGLRTTAIFQAMAQTELGRSEDVERTLEPLLEALHELAPYQRALLEEVLGSLDSDQERDQ